MNGKLWALTGALAIAAIALLLWPIFADGEPWLVWLLAAFVVGGGALVIGALRSPRRAFRYALAGIPLGFVLGGVGLFFLVSGSGSGDGWDDLAAVAAGILGAFVGSILGGAVGAAIGASRDRGSAERSAHSA